jgi:hypothetical protein
MFYYAMRWNALGIQCPFLEGILTARSLDAYLGPGTTSFDEGIQGIHIISAPLPI